MGDLLWRTELDDAEILAVRELSEAAKRVDGGPEVPADGTLPGEFRGGEHLLHHSGGLLSGYLHLDTEGDDQGHQVAELIVHPEHRRRGLGAALFKSLVDRAGTAADRLRIWSHGDHPGAARLAAHAGFGRVRELLVLRAEVAGADWPEPAPRGGITLRTFRPGRDEAEVIRVNAAAFDWHPEQGSLSVDELRAAEAQDWFDPDGFFLAVTADDRLAGFHWTKVHPADPARFGGRATGEVYVVGVDPGAQGSGLGKALTLAGLRHLAAAGLSQVILYVEGDNAAALAVYTGLGFTRYQADVQYGR